MKKARMLTEVGINVVVESEEGYVHTAVQALSDLLAKAKQISLLLKLKDGTEITLFGTDVFLIPHRTVRISGEAAESLPAWEWHPRKESQPRAED